MWQELKILIDGYNRDDCIAYSVQERVQHRFFVVWRNPVTGDHGKCEYENEIEANKAFSKCMAQQMSFF